MPNSSKRSLVVVESPAKAKTIGRHLGSGYIVKASMGHVRDLPAGRLGVDVDHDFAPQYEVMKEKKKVVAELKKAAQGVGSVYLATDPDREGEAISWHLLEATGWKNIPIHRVVFHEITPEAIKGAFSHPRDIDMNLVDAQQARRILDRLVGYELSPLLWKKVQRGLSAGRVQSVALRLVVERDRAIAAFTPMEYWLLEASLKPKGAALFTAKLHSIASDRKRVPLSNQADAETVVGDLKNATYAVAQVKRTEAKSRPAAPFITSTLQQEAWRKLRFSAKRTMTVAQQLYEGLPLGDDGNTGLITYMRTDSPQVAVSAVRNTREYIHSRFGEDYLPRTPRIYTSKSKSAQEAHEAIRPTDVTRDPDSLKAHLLRDQLRLYELIWKRMVASQMSDMLRDVTKANVSAQGHSGEAYVFQAEGSVITFPGFRTLYMEDTDDAGEEEEMTLPKLIKSQSLDCTGLNSNQKFTQPPAHYTEASLIKMLEEKGIGRPSTYAPIVSTIVDRQYVNKDRGSLQATKLGEVVNDQLTSHFPEIMDPGFTAQFEERLDEVTTGNQKWVPLLHEFYTPFSAALARAQEEMPRVKVEEPTDEVCEICTRPMVVKRGRFGPFISCSGFPECKNSRPLLKKTGVLCPTCGGELVQRKAKGGGRLFYGCSNYPECSFTVSRAPLEPPCPECEGLLIAAGRDRAQCTNCAYKGSIPETEAEAV
jgi:DNA topoisomerase-1